LGRLSPTILAARVLISDSDQDLRRKLAIILNDQGVEVIDAENGRTALRMLAQGVADIIMLDPMLPGFNGWQGVRELRQLRPDFPVILITATGTVENAAEAGSWGVRAILTKPLRSDEVILTLAMALGKHPIPFAGRTAAAESRNPENDVMVSAAIRVALAQSDLVAATNFTVIIVGETGAGKEVMARTIHQRSGRGNGPFISVDCGAIPPTLIESELFGHTKGAFTGADRNRTGSFEAAAGGTLFLDEIGNLPLEMQVKLLRVLQERRICRVGCCDPVELNARILVATNDNLEDMIEQGRFRRDIYYRLNEFTVAVPPLRERGEDILILARRFIEWTCQELKKDIQDISLPARQMLLDYQWPGNVRELRNVVRRAVLLARSKIEPEHLLVITESVQQNVSEWNGSTDLEPKPESNTNLSYKEIVRQSVARAEQEILAGALKQTMGNMKRAAQILRIDYKTLRTKVKRYGVHA
jgi:DNA-binding NtrC family response regulator